MGVETIQKNIGANNIKVHRMTKLPAVPSRHARLSSKLRVAIHARVTQGLTVTDACKKAGLSTAGWFKAMQRPAVLALCQEVQGKFVADTDGMRAHAKAIAITVALDLMQNSKDEKIRARMAEFLAGDGKAPSVSVSIDARQALPQASYAFIRPDDLDAPSRAIEGAPEGR
ncbi:MAG: hypothetical protein ABI832_11625 [bacterium]